MVVSAVDTVTGTYLTFNETLTDLVQPVVASSAIPFAFPNQHFEEQGWIAMDGGTVWNTNIVSAIQRCRETVEDDRDIILLSNGHICPIWYATLIDKGIIPEAEKDGLRKIGRLLEGHPKTNIP